jgi:outer membrane protein OmpA-like peptidoglycan-associated protein
MKGIQFENGRATIKPNSYKILDDIAKIFIENPTYVIEVQGHTDNVGQYDYNMDLSDRRAHAVRLYLINKGVPAARMSARGYGPDMPIDDNNTAEGRSKNRRVEFQITFEEVTYEVVNNRAE